MKPTLTFNFLKKQLDNGQKFYEMNRNSADLMLLDSVYFYNF